MKIRLSTIPAGQNFEVWGQEFTVLEQGAGRTFVLSAKEVKVLSYMEPQEPEKMTANDFRSSSIKQWLKTSYLNSLRLKGMRDGDLLPFEMDLKCTLGQHEYGTIEVLAGLLTLEEYGQYYNIIPLLDSFWWLATPLRTPSYKSPTRHDVPDVWCVTPNGSFSYQNYSSAGGVRPVLTLNSSLLVSCPDVQEKLLVEYVAYLNAWAKEHQSLGLLDFDGWCGAKPKRGEKKSDGEAKSESKNKRKGKAESNGQG